MKKWLALLALILAYTPVYAQAPTWTLGTLGIARNVTPNQIGVNIGTSSANFIPIGYVASGIFTPVGVDSSSILSFGADPSGVSSSSSAINAALVTGRRLRIPCGTYLIDAPIFLPSNTDVGGAGACTVLKISATLATDTSAQFGVLRHVFTNNNYTSGNTDIYVHDLAIDNTSGPTTGAHIHALGFYKVTRAGVYNITITSASGKLMDDGTAFVASKEYYVRNNKIYGTINACIDQWGGSSDFDISGNLCDGLNLANYGILVSGFNTDLTAATSQRGSIVGNVVKNFPQAGIWLQGGWNTVSGGGATYGLVKDIQVVGNHVSSISTYHGIYLSDANYNSVVGNTLENIGSVGIILSSENAGAVSGNTVVGNTIRSCNASGANNPCIQLMAAASSNTIAENTISGTTQPYSIIVSAGAANNVVRGGVSPVGVNGDVADAGTATQFQVGNAFVGAPTFRSLTGYVKGNGASAATAAATVPTTDLSGTLQAAQEPAHTGDVTNSAGSLALTLATVNSNVGTFGSATQVPQITVNAKGLATAVSNVTVTPALGSITGLGTGVATALGIAANTAGGPVVPSSALTNNAVVTGGGSGASPKSSGCSIDANSSMTCASATAFTPQIKVVNTTNDTSAPYFMYQKQRAGAIVSTNDALGTFNFQGYDGSAYQTAAYFTAVVDSASAGNVAAHIEWWPGGAHAFDFYSTFNQSLLMLRTPAIQSNGGTPTVTGSGACTIGSQVGGKTAGKFTATAACAAGQTYTISGMTSAQNGYVCDANDRTTSGVVFQQTGDSTTSAVMTVRSTGVANSDVIQFKCMGY